MPVISGRIMLVLLLAAAAVGSGWLVNRVSRNDAVTSTTTGLDPDYYMEDFTTLTIGKDGTPLNRLQAAYMEHNPVDDSLELHEPRLEVFRDNEDPLFITADRGLVTNDNEVIFLRGKVRMWEENAEGGVNFQVDTSDVKVLVVDEYAETDQLATIVARRTRIAGRGMRAYFADNRLEILSHENTVITQPDTI